jgi:type VII secretion protein essC
MAEKYKITIRYKNIYREIPLNEDTKVIRIGTFGKCAVRFDRSQFFENFFAEIIEDNGKWLLNCSENIYISPDGIMKLSVKEMNHGDTILLKYQTSNQEILSIGFLIDFDSENKSYDNVVDISNVSDLKIGGAGDCELKLSDELIGGDSVSIIKRDDKYYIRDNNTKYGVYINGQRIKNEVQLMDYDFISITSHSLYFKYGKLYTSNQMTVSGLNYNHMQSDGNYPKFSRNTRIKSTLPEEKINILDPPPLPQKPKNNLLMSLIPAFAMLGLTIVLRGVMGGGGSFVIFSVCSMSLGILTSIFNFVNGRREYRKSIDERKEKYDKYIKKKRSEIESARNEEREILDNVYYSSDREEEMLREFSGDLFDRSKDDDDFLCIRIGTGILESKRIIDCKAQEKLDAEDELAEIPERIRDEYRMIDKVPIICSLFEANGIGVIGSDDKLYEMLKIMVLDLCTRHYQNDVKLFFITDESNIRKISWVRFLPHVHNDMLGMRNIICDEKSKNILFEYLYKEMSDREETKRNEPHIVLFVYDDVGIKRHPISRFIEKAGSIGVTFIFFENRKSFIPQHCSMLINLNENDFSGTLIQSKDGNKAVDFSYDIVSDNTAEYASMRLAPVYCEEISLEGTLTKNISLYQLLEITSADDLDLSERWKNSQVFKSMAAPLGVKTKNEMVYLDLHDKFHGPHGLVAGTTGSGKSEILQTYILSMATLFHPYEVSFVIIDFKGGGMVNQFRTLPHLVGAITNIDGREIDRSLKSIKAELRKRQRLFAEAEVNHIDKYIKKFKAGDVEEPLPHLIVIVDEFAELKAEQPEFMKELISAARIGRSLGVHLILATQKPAGQVNEQIWSNSKFKLCLKVQSQSDSNEVLKSPLAAEIKEPGRAYLQVGNNEIFELFQSAYSGCPAKADESNVKEFKIYEVAFSGLKETVYEQTKPKSESAEETQLNAVVNYVHNYCTKSGISKLPDICLPPLPEIITLDKSERTDTADIICEIGIYDDPDNQYQGTVSVDLGNQNTMIIGSSQYGKTNLLQWIIKNLTEKYTPQELNIYILDFGSMVLKNFESLKHIGGVVCASDDEKLKNLFKLLNDETSKRKEKLMSIGVSSFNSYKDAGYTDMPQILLMIDNLTALRELYLNDNDELLHICREGISVGISVIAANAQLSGIGYKYLSNFANKIGLYCNDSGEYSNLFGSCRMRPLAVPGRCIIEIDKEFYECQTYLSFKGEKEIERVDEMRRFIKNQNERFSGMGARLIPVIPKLLDEEFIKQNYDVRLKPYSVICGLDYSNVSAKIFDFRTMSILSICGREKSGKGNFIRYILSQLEKNSEEYPIEIVIADDVSRKYSDLSSVSRYILSPEDVKDIITEWYERLKKRYEMLISRDIQFEKEPLLLLIIQNNDVHDVISKDKAILAMYKEMLIKYKAMKFCVIYSQTENAQIAFSAPDTMKMIKDYKNYLIFDDIQNIKLTDVPIQVARQFKKPLETGDVYYVNGGGFAKLKTVLYKH